MAERRRVFISYSAVDQEIAQAACSHLEDNGVPCWIAPRDIPAGDWSAAIVDAITASDVLLLVLSEDSNASPQVKREVERAAAKGLQLVPFRIGDFPLSKHMEYFISTSHWIDGADAPRQQLDRLLGAVRTVLGEQSSAPCPDPAPAGTGGPEKQALAHLKRLFPPPAPDRWRASRGPRQWPAAIVALFVGAAGIFFGLRGLLAVAVPAAVQPDGLALAQFPILRVTGLLASGLSLGANAGLLLALRRLLAGRGDGLALAAGFTRGQVIIVTAWLILSEAGVLLSPDPLGSRALVMNGIFTTAAGALVWLLLLMALLWVARDRPGSAA